MPKTTKDKDELRFKTNIAIETGNVNAAVIHYTFSLFLDAKIKQQKHIFKHTDGNSYAWLYTSYPNIVETLIPYLSIRQARTAIEKLIDKGLLIKSEQKYNKKEYDQTNWYTTPNHQIPVSTNNKIDNFWAQNTPSISVTDDRGSVTGDRPIPIREPISLGPPHPPQGTNLRSQFASKFSTRSLSLDTSYLDASLEGSGVAAAAAALRAKTPELPDFTSNKNPYTKEYEITKWVLDKLSKPPMNIDITGSEKHRIVNRHLHKKEITIDIIQKFFKIYSEDNPFPYNWTIQKFCKNAKSHLTKLYKQTSAKNKETLLSISEVYPWLSEDNAKYTTSISQAFDFVSKSSDFLTLIQKIPYYGRSVGLMTYLHSFALDQNHIESLRNHFQNNDIERKILGNDCLFTAVLLSEDKTFSSVTKKLFEEITGVNLYHLTQEKNTVMSMIRQQLHRYEQQKILTTEEINETTNHIDRIINRTTDNKRPFYAESTTF